MSFNLRMLACVMGFLAWMVPVVPAVADEVFICDGNQVVRVAIDQLEAMKRTNACVAAHYGLEVKAPAAAKARTAEVKPQNDAGSATKAKPSAVKADKKVQKSDPAAATPVKPPAKRSAKKTPSATATSPSFTIYGPGEALPVEEIAADPSDHRNVRVLNAKTKPAKWYKHVY